MYVGGLVGYLGLICATVFGLLVPAISVQLVPLLADYNYLAFLLVPEIMV